MKKLIVIVMVIVPSIAGAQVPPVPPLPPPPPEICTPQCRAGFLCNQGTCVSACNPLCGESELCTANGQCVSKCNPACGPNELCTGDGQCHSRCNPLCGPGQQCTATGACIGDLAITRRPPSAGSHNWASAAGGLGLVATAVIAGLTIGIVAANNPDVGIPLGITATVIGGVSIPIVASGAASARRTYGVTGSPGLRLAGWIGYGFALTDAVVLLGLALSDVEVPSGVAGSVGVLGAASASFMAIDAFDSARQARAMSSGGATPYVGVLRDSAHQPVTTCGLAWRF